MTQNIASKSRLTPFTFLIMLLFAAMVFIMPFPTKAETITIAGNSNSALTAPPLSVISEQDESLILNQNIQRNTPIRNPIGSDDSTGVYVPPPYIPPPPAEAEAEEEEDETTDCSYADGYGDREFRDWRANSHQASGDECNPRLAPIIGQRRVANWAECQSYCESLGAGCCTAMRRAHMGIIEREYGDPPHIIRVRRPLYNNHFCIAYGQNFPQTRLNNGRCAIGAERLFVHFGQGACPATREVANGRRVLSSAITPNSTRCQAAQNIPTGNTPPSLQCAARLCR